MSSAMESHQGSPSGILKIGVEEYFEGAFDLRHAKKKEVLRDLLKSVPHLSSRGIGHS